MASLFGRKVVAYKVNKSGGTVVKGDVVVPDTSNDNAFTTTTSAAVVTGVWVVDETIPSNGTGRVVLAGHVELVNVSASVTRGHTGATHTVAKQAASTGGTGRTAGTFCKFTTGGTTPEADIWPVDLLGSSLTNPMTTAGDIIYSSDGSGTPARLAKGSAGAVLAMLNGALAWNAGTSFPGSPATNDRYFRTDLGMEFYYDGTRWLSTQLGQLIVSPHDGTSDTPISSTSGGWRGVVPVWAGSDIWLVSTQTWFFVNGGTALSGSHKWVGVLTKEPANTTLDTISIDSGASSTYRRSTKVDIGAALGSTNFTFALTWTKTGTPGTLFTSTVVSFRYIAT